MQITITRYDESGEEVTKVAPFPSDSTLREVMADCWHDRNVVSVQRVDCTGRTIELLSAAAYAASIDK